MSDKGETQAGLDPADRDRLFQAYALEYQTLWSEIIATLSGRWQFLGFMTTAAALLASAAGHLGGGTWLLLVLASGVFAFGLLSFWLLGRTVVIISARLATIESKMNAFLPVQREASAPMSWQTERQERSLWGRITFGPLAKYR